MRVLVCGSRNWTNYSIIYRELSKLPSNTVIIHGAAKGADTIAGSIARHLNLEVINNGKGFPADWNRYGRAAGPIRNQLMITEGRPDLVLAFHDDIDNSRGTKDMVTRARKAMIDTIVING